ncbi:hypothetical protein B0H16DRAFT_1477716 [Mycena metata]|uniref:Uncharacterized protein n=1 Tax=Mycena metata TaxID=1033252 RepID=A0AAD7MG80_9AGAR|nr:hypothetical protein B0H16DRAFT_1477716 [Mycena metata]
MYKSVQFTNLCDLRRLGTEKNAGKSRDRGRENDECVEDYNGVYGVNAVNILHDYHHPSRFHDAKHPSRYSHRSRAVTTFSQPSSRVSFRFLLPPPPPNNEPAPLSVWAKLKYLNHALDQHVRNGVGKDVGKNMDHLPEGKLRNRPMSTKERPLTHPISKVGSPRSILNQVSTHTAPFYCQNIAAQYSAASDLLLKMTI